MQIFVINFELTCPLVQSLFLNKYYGLQFHFNKCHFLKLLQNAHSYFEAISFKDGNTATKTHTHTHTQTQTHTHTHTLEHIHTQTVLQTYTNDLNNFTT